jgi:GNAT superfamily N-acetyltransferase
VAALRLAHPGEEQELTELIIRSKASWGYDEAFMASCQAELKVSSEDVLAGRVTVAVAAGPLSTLGLYVLNLDLADPELISLFVDPQAMGAGVGGLLLADALARANQAGVELLLIESDPNAEPFYIGQGAVRTGQRRSGSTGRLLPLLAIPTASPLTHPE